MKAPRSLVHVLQGFLMGAVDIIPGVSGGTVALILGIYARLISALSRFDLTLLAHLRQREWRAALRHVDAGFLALLGGGIVLGFAGLASLMHYLLEHHPQHTFAVFFGLILASSWLVARMVPQWSLTTAVSLAAATAGAYALVALPQFDSPPQGAWYMALCGGVAICAMVLPGVSGAFILLILGKYQEMTAAVRSLVHGDVTLEALGALGAFFLGAGLGLLAFTKLLRWLLIRHEALTLAVLCGFMLGSLRKIWPFKLDLTPEVAKLSHKQFANVLPAWSDDTAWLSIGFAAVACVLVFVLDRLSRKDAPPSDETLPVNKLEGLEP